MATVAEVESAVLESLVDTAENGIENRTADGRMQRMADPRAIAEALDSLQKFKSTRTPAYKNFLVARPYRW
jgi:hypothetical protein